MEGLYGYESPAPPRIPLLAEKCEANADLTQWTCTLQPRRDVP